MKPAHTITLHALDQCEARHGYRPRNCDADAAVIDIMDGRAVMAWRHPSGHEEWIVRLACAEVRVVYDPVTCCIITVLPTSSRQMGKIIENRPAFQEQRYYAKGKARGKRTVWVGGRP